ncbi:hypothetical protein [Desulfolithobacter sp.]
MSTAQPDIRPIKGPIALESGFNWLPWLIGALAAFLLITAVFFYFRRKQSRKPSGAAHETALTRLAEMRKRLDTERSCDLAARTADILRKYIEDRFRLAAPTLTTREFIIEMMTASRQLPQELTGNMELLQEILTKCDMAKFARCSPDREELASILNTVEQFVQATKIKPGKGEKEI